MSQTLEPLSLVIVLALLGAVPLIVVMTTSFVKIAVVLSLVRNALGVQQIPPNLALYGLSFILTLYIMAPVLNNVAETIRTEPKATQSIEGLFAAVKNGAEPMRVFLMKHSKPAQRQFFYNTAAKLWPKEMMATTTPNDFLIIIPAFLVTEITEAFEIGFLIYLPFVVIDLIVSNILLAMGMMMVSPVTISLPLKLFLFVMVDGWARLIQGLVLSYV
jgi:type III secretion protein R